MTVLVGGIGQLYQGDFDLGRRAAERLTAEDLGPDVRVEDLYYGALAVAQLLGEVRPRALILVGAEAGARPPGTVERRRIRASDLAGRNAQEAVESAGTGYVTVGLAVEVAWGLGVLPERTVTIEVEPAETGPSEDLSPEALDGLEAALDLVRTEVRRIPLMELLDELRPRLHDDRLEPAVALDAMRELVWELRLVEDQGRWGAAFAHRDRVRLAIAEGLTGEGMDHLDWSLWWGLIEELDRLEPLEAAG